MNTEYKKSERTKLNRVPARGFYDKKTVYSIIDEAQYCHVSFVQDGQPFIIPTIHARIEDEIFLHGAKASRLLKHIIAGNEICIAITLLDGLVLARSVFHHTMNYRSVVLFGKGREVTDENEKLEAFRSITNHLLPGRWEDARQPNQKEIDSTGAVLVKIDEASAKIRTGPPIDDEEDYGLKVWAGLLPIKLKTGVPEPDPKLPENFILPSYLKKYKD
ncbi:pyridoxamine 5'-phosphate oxidase family protein [Bacteroidota bacterium]